MKSTFSAGGFKSLGAKQVANPETAGTSEGTKAQEDKESHDDEAAAFSCPQDRCVRVFQRFSALEKHLSLEKYTKSSEKRSLFDLAKIGYKSALEEGVGIIPTLKAVSGIDRQTDQCNEEGWALKSSNKAYRFSDKQRAYLDAKFNIGQTTGRKLDGDVVAKEMRRAQGTEGAVRFRVPDSTADRLLLFAPGC